MITTLNKVKSTISERIWAMKLYVIINQLEEDFIFNLKSGHWKTWHIFFLFWYLGNILLLLTSVVNWFLSLEVEPNANSTSNTKNKHHDNNPNPGQLYSILTFITLSLSSFRCWKIKSYFEILIVAITLMQLWYQ